MSGSLYVEKGCENAYFHSDFGSVLNQKNRNRAGFRRFINCFFYLKSFYLPELIIGKSVLPQIFTLDIRSERL